jgi:general stress protein 26
LSRKHEKFQEILGQFKTGMLVTRAPDGLLQSRPMAVAEVVGEAELLFITAADSDKAQGVQLDPLIAVTFQAEHRFLSISGIGRVKRDVERARRVWTEGWWPWFPGGPEDPSLVFIHMKPERAEYWDRAGINGLTFAFESARAIFAGGKPRTSVERHGEVQF